MLSIATPVFADQQSGESTVYYENIIKAPKIGNYQFKLESHEVPSHEWLPIISKSYFPKTVAQYITEVDNTAPSAVYEAKAVANVDVIFAFGDMEQSKTMEDYITTFESRLGASGNNINAYVEKIETSTFDMSQMSAQQIMDTWVNYPGSNISGNYEAGWKVMGDALGATTNVNWTGFWDPQFIDIKDATFEFTARVGNHQDPQGWTFRMNKNGSTYSFYALEINHEYGRVNLARIDSWLPGNYETHGGPLYHGMINGQDGTYSGGTGQAGSNQGAVGEFLATAPFPSGINGGSGYYKIITTGNNIKVFAGNKTEPIIDYTDNSSKALKTGSFGPYTCSQFTSSFANVKVTMGATKTLGEALSDVMWRDNSLRFVVYGEDTIPEYMISTDNKDYQYTVTKLLNSNAYLIGLGKYTNKLYMENLIKNISMSNTEMKGKFIYNSPIISALNQSCDWIVELARKYEKPSQYLLVNTYINWNTIYKDYEKDVPLNFGEHDGSGKQPQDTSDRTLANSWGIGLTHLYNQDKIYAEKWHYRHINTHYDNSPIVASFNEVWIQDPVEIFNNPGLYRINYKRRDNPFYSDTDLTNPFNEYRYWSTDYDPLPDSEVKSGGDK